MENKDLLIGKCGFYCPSCPTYQRGKCKGCMISNKEGECFTRDCVINKKLNYCGECKNFPCHTILEKDKVTLLDKKWLKFQKNIKDEGKENG